MQTDIITVVKSQGRPYGYSLKHSEKQSWLIDGFHEGWYKYKRDAVARANERNAKGDTKCLI